MTKRILSLYRVYGSSMEPALSGAQYIVASSLPYVMGTPRVGDVVVAKHPRRSLYIIKRISKIKRGRFYLIGDNREESTDSRQFGPIIRSAIIAKVILS